MVPALRGIRRARSLTSFRGDELVRATSSPSGRAVLVHALRATVARRGRRDSRPQASRRDPDRAVLWRAPLEAVAAPPAVTRINLASAGADQSTTLDRPSTSTRSRLAIELENPGSARLAGGPARRRQAGAPARLQLALASLTRREVGDLPWCGARLLAASLACVSSSLRPGGGCGSPVVT